MSNLILLITNKEDVTIDFVVNELNLRKLNYFRFNTEEMCKSIDISFTPNNNQFILYSNKNTINLFDVKSVYYRRPKTPYPSNHLTPGETSFFLREQDTILEGIYKFLGGKKWLNNVYDIRNAENKLYQLLIANKLGFQIPKSLITNIPKKATEFIDTQKSIFKSIRNGFIEEPFIESKILYTNAVDNNFRDKIDRIKDLPIYLQENIDKLSDLRVTVVNKIISAVEIDSQIDSESMTDWRKASYILPHKKVQLPQEIERRIMKLCQHFKLNFAAIDLAKDTDGNYIFFEINPNGQWGWIEKLLDVKISKQIVDYLEDDSE